jgi:Ca2+-transporting ATPase
MEQKRHRTGLTLMQVQENREKYGENILTPPEKESVFVLFLEKFKDPIIRILLVALLLSGSVSCYQYFSGLALPDVFLEPLGILVAVLLATCISFIFEYNANKKFEILNKVNDETLVKVIREGNVTEISRKEVVVGDIVILVTGEEIPADGLLLEAISLQVNESTLTGEPLINKTTDEALFDEDATYPSNQVLRGSTVMDGYGVMEVKKTGDTTEYGKVYQGSQIDNNIKTPLNIQLDKLAKMITYASYSIAALIIGFRLFQYFYSVNEIDWVDAGGYILNTLMMAITVIVVAVPEGLPMSVTLSLAMSMKRMLQTNNLVRKMHACETMGAVTVICTDKTGTLTQNQMQVYCTDIYSLPEQRLGTDEISELMKEGISVNSTAYLDFSDPEKIKAIGNPTEAALLLWLNSQQIDYLDIRKNTKITEQLTFSTERKYMATVAESSCFKKKILYVKGAPEIVLNLSRYVLVDGEKIPVKDYRATVEKQLLAYQNQAMRTLSFAYQILEDDKPVFLDGKLNTEIPLTYLGISAISDPIRTDVPEAVYQCMDAGIRVKIVTGDTPGTAKEIGRQIGLWTPEENESHHITGAEFSETPDAELLERILDLKIMSRARPMDKERLVKLLQKKGQVVAVTGDGTNDASALKAAQVGLSMGDGTTVAKEASDITILDNSFSSIARAVMWGRSLYQNIQRFILFQMTINVAACLIVLIGSFIGMESPLTVTQMLWVNLIMDTFAALALASLPPDEKVMRNKPRKSADHIISHDMAVKIIGVGLIFVVFLFGVLQYFKHVDVVSLHDFNLKFFFSSFFYFAGEKSHLTTYELSMFFSIFVFLQFWNMFNAKVFGTNDSAFKDLKESWKGFILIALVIVMGQVIIVQFGGKMFSVTPVALIDWLLIIASTSVVLWIGELIRLGKRIYAKSVQSK